MFIFGPLPEKAARYFLNPKGCCAWYGITVGPFFIGVMFKRNRFKEEQKTYQGGRVDG